MIGGDESISSNPARDKRLRGLDVMRGIAISLVMLRHSWPSSFGGAGVVGVAMFFVLSGFLITKNLVVEHAHMGHINKKLFYSRRALRLIPALVFTVIAVAFVHLWANPLGDKTKLPSSIILSFAYLADFHIPGMTPALGHLWSLSVEEQFYLFWPSLFVLLIKARSGKKLFNLVLVFAAVLPVISALMISRFDRLYVLPTTWAVALLGGCWLAINPANMLVTGAPRKFWLVISAGLLSALCLVPELKASFGLYVFGVLTITLASSVLLLCLRHAPLDNGLGATFAFIGKISYGLYLWSIPMQLWISVWAHTGPEQVGFLIILMTFIAALTSWYLVENPINRLASRRFLGLANESNRHGERKID